MNLFDQLYEVPDEDEHLEPVFDIDPIYLPRIRSSLCTRRNVMVVYILIKVDFGHRENIAVCSTRDEARAIKTGYELDLMEDGNVCGISYYIEEHQVV